MVRRVVVCYEEPCCVVSMCWCYVAAAAVYCSHFKLLCNRMGLSWTF